MTVASLARGQYYFSNALDGIITMRNNRVDYTICINVFALYDPVRIWSNFTFINENKSEVSCHFSVIIVPGRVHVIIKVRSIECFLYGNLFCVRFCVVVYLLLYINARSLLQL